MQLSIVAKTLGLLLMVLMDVGKIHEVEALFLEND